MDRKEHLTKEGLQQIINLRASINLGLSEKLKTEFPDVKLVNRLATPAGGCILPSGGRC
jgi:hypothetical protein